MSYIDREATVKALNRLCDRVCQYSKAQRFTMCGACPLGDAFIVIEYDIPDADVEPIRHGEWVVDTIYPSGVKKFHCSVCGQERTVHEKYEGVFRKNYCSNCGTRMDKGV